MSAGLFGKFHVERNDGRDQLGGDKADARYFVLDYVHDPYARAALDCYADACEMGLPQLAADLRAALAGTISAADQPRVATMDDPGCTCYPSGFSPETFEGPQRDCPVHGEGRVADPF